MIDIQTLDIQGKVVDLRKELTPDQQIKFDALIRDVMEQVRELERKTDQIYRDLVEKWENT